MALVEDRLSEETTLPGSGSVGDYYELMKPRVMSLVIFTALAGIVLAPGVIHPLIAAVAILAIAVGAGASGALNMWYDADIDRLMSRTLRRPIPDGRVEPQEALAFGSVLSVLSVLVLGVTVNWFAGFLLAFTIFFYVAVYTMWLKRRTPQNIVIGGAAGAFPPMIGWAAVTGGVSMESFVLFLIIFIWTPPHFWALALAKAADYERAGVPMMPNVAGGKSTRLQILLYSALLAPVGVLPYMMGFAGPVYGGLSTALGAVFVALAWNIYREGDGAGSRKALFRLFGFSIFYLFALFAILMAEVVAAQVWGMM